MKRRLKQPVVYSLYALISILVVGLGAMLTVKNKVDSTPVSDIIEDFNYVSKSIFEDNFIPVVNAKTMIIRPYTDNEVSLKIGYYDYQSEESEQRSSIIYYEGTYIPSSGVYYAKGDQFDVISILDGTVLEVKEDTTLGNVITIEHANNVKTVYQSVTDITVNVGDEITQGTIIAKSGTSNIAKELNNHLYFEMNVDGKTVNPETMYEKAIDEL